MEAKPGGCGVPSPLVQIRLRRHGRVAGARRPHVRRLLRQTPRTTAAAFEDSWFRTGDQVELDDEGLPDDHRPRARALIPQRRRGQPCRSRSSRCSPATDTIADACDHSASARAAWGEVVCAAVVLVDGRSITLDAPAPRCRGPLASHKHPRRMLVVDSIPRTPATPAGPAPSARRAGDVERHTLTALSARRATRHVHTRARHHRHHASRLVGGASTSRARGRPRPAAGRRSAHRDHRRALHRPRRAPRPAQRCARRQTCATKAQALTDEQRDAPRASTS